MPEKGILQSLFTNFPTISYYSTSTVTATAAVAQFKSCISSTQFLSTTPCSPARRKRTADDDDAIIHATPILPYNLYKI